MSGWIKLHRKILDNPVVCKDGDHVSVWMYLLLNATHKEYPAMFAGERITLQPGQLITGRKSISEKFGISESKVQRILKLFENEQQIEQQSSNKNRLISIVSWADYQEDEQQSEQQVNNKRTTTEQQVNTNKNVKNVKNDKKVKNKDIIPKISFAESIELTQAEYDRLVSEFGEDITKRAIDYLSSYKAEKGYKTKSDNLTIRRWVIDAVTKQRGGKAFGKHEGVNGGVARESQFASADKNKPFDPRELERLGIS